MWLDRLATVRDMDHAVAVALARSRWEYAQQQLEHLGSAIREFQHRRPYETPREFVPERREHVWTFRIIEEPPADLGFQISTVVHHLRATLDNLVWGLAKAERGSGEALREIVYPIAVSREDYWRRDGMGELLRDAPAQRVAVLPEALQAAVEATQPFQAKQPDRHPLRMLQLLSNRDKHRRVAVAAAAMVGSAVQLRTELGDLPVTKRDALGIPRSPVSVVKGPLVDGAVFARLEMPDVDFEVPANVQFAFDHVFADGVLLGEPVFYVLVEVLGFIEDEVFPRFQAAQ